MFGLVKKRTKAWVGKHCKRQAMVILVHPCVFEKACGGHGQSWVGREVRAGR